MRKHNKTFLSQMEVARTVNEQTRKEIENSQIDKSTLDYRILMKQLNTVTLLLDHILKGGEIL